MSIGWGVLALLLALVLIGHDLMMASPEAHAVPGAMASAHVAGRDHVAANMVMLAAPDWSATAPHDASPCPASRVAKAPASIATDVAAERVNVLPATSELDRKTTVRRLSDYSSPPLTASRRRALLQVFLM